MSQKETIEEKNSDKWGAFSKNLFVLGILLSFVSFWKIEFGIVSIVFLLGAIYAVQVSKMAFEVEKEHSCGGAGCENKANCESLSDTLAQITKDIPK